MSKRHPIDDQFKNKLEHHELQPDPKVWENISGTLNKKSKPTGLIWTAIAVVAIAASMWMFSDQLFNSSKSTTVNQLVANEAQEPSNMAASQSKGLSSKEEASIAYTESKETTSSSDALSEAAPKTQKETADFIKTKEASAIAGTSETIRPQKQELSTVSTFAEASVQKSSKKGTQAAIEDQTKRTQEQDNKESSTSQRVNDKKISVATSDQNRMIASESNSDEKAMDSYKASSSASTLVSSTDILSWDEQELAIINEQEAGFLAFQIDRFRRIEEDQKSLLKDLDLCALINPNTNECPTFGALRKRYQVDLYSTTGWLLQSLGTNDPTGTEWGNHLQERRDSETGAWIVGMGVRVGTQFSSGLSLRGGLQISRGQIRLDYDDETQRREVINVSVDTIVDNQGNTVVIWDTLSRQVTGIIPRTEYNDFTQLDIPLTVGYTFLGRDYDIEVNGGVMLNAMFRRSGHIFGPGEADFVSIDSDNPNAFNAYRSKIGLSFIISAAVNYHLSDQFSVFAEPQLRYYNEAVSPDDYFLKEQWFNINLQLGGRYSF